MNLKHLLAALMIAAAFVVAGCGDDDGDGATSPPAQTSEPSRTSEPSEEGGGEQAADGEEIFASAGCASCHTLSAAGARGMTGPNLDDLQPDFQRVRMKVIGGGGGMPSFEGQLSDAEIEAVARYVSENAGR